jgi:hypothetical protein
VWYGRGVNRMRLALTARILWHAVASGALASVLACATEMSARRAEQTLLPTPDQACLDVPRDSGLLESQRRNVEVLQGQLRQTRDRFIAGEVPRTEVAQAEKRLAEGRAAVLTAERNYARSLANCRQSISGAPGILAPAMPADRCPIDGILFEEVERIPEAFFGQFAAAGRLVAVVIAGVVGKGMVFRSERGQASGRALFDAMAPMLPGFKRAPTFVF